MNMRLFRQKMHPPQPDPGIPELAERIHRLEIANNELRERVDSLEGRHASLSASVRGRLGGRGNKAPAPPVMFPMGLGG